MIIPLSKSLLILKRVSCLDILSFFAIDDILALPSLSRIANIFLSVLSIINLTNGMVI